MKRIVSTLILTLALIAIFSSFGYIPTEKPNGNGWGTKHKGDSGLIIPGNGEQMAEVSFEPTQGNKRENEPLEKTQLTEEKSIPNSTADKMETVDTSEVRSEEIKEEHNKVDGMIIAFWHGVAAVLIGEASALLVAFAWMKIRGGK